MTELRQQEGKQTWAEFLAEDNDHKKLSDQRTEIEEHIKAYEKTVSEIEWKLLSISEATNILQQRLFEMQHEKVPNECAYERLESFIKELTESRYALFDEAGAAARYRSDMKSQYERVDDQCGDRWKIVRQLFDGA